MWELTESEIEQFLAENKIYQNLLHSELTFQESGNLKSNFLEKVGLDNVKLFTYCNQDQILNLEFSPEMVDGYLIFLDMYDYPIDEFFLAFNHLKVARNFYKLSDPIRERLNLIGKEMQQSLIYPVHDRQTQIYLRLGCLKLLKKNNFIPSFDCLDTTLKNVEVVKYLYHRTEYYRENIRYALIICLRQDLWDTADFLIKNQHMTSDVISWLFNECVSYNRLTGFKFLLQHVKLPTDLLDRCLKSQRYDMARLLNPTQIEERYLLQLIEQPDLYKICLKSCSKEKIYVSMSQLAAMGNLELIQYLVKIYPDLNYSNALRKAMRNEQVEVIKFLRSQGVTCRIGNREKINFQIRELLN